MGKIKIPKNRDIEEIVEQEEGKTKKETMEEVIVQMEKREKEFKDRIKCDNMSMNKKLQNVYKRKDAELADEKRKIAYLKAMDKIKDDKEQR